MSALNSNPIEKRIIYKITAELASPALIGSGESDNTDNDVLVNAKGDPYLPGSALAGVLRHTLGKTAEADLLFGSPDNDSRGNGKMSALWIMDSAFDKKGRDIIELDGVALDPENKVAITKKKYDFQAVPAGAAFTIRLMLVSRRNDDSQKLESLTDQLLSELHSGDISVGAKVNRGFGRVICQGIKRHVFDFTSEGKEKALEDWINFSWDDDMLTHYTPPDAAASLIAITVSLKLDGSIIIRDTRNISCDDGNADYKHISQDGIPVVYGTSWAGAFRGGLHNLLFPLKGKDTEEYMNSFFGFVGEDDKTTLPSRIRFDMSILEKEEYMAREQGYRTITRVKINRFTGGAAAGALFTERPWIGGKTSLTIRYPKGDEQCETLLRLALDALDKGIITIGGETAVGRGVFRVMDNPLAPGRKEDSAA